MKYLIGAIIAAFLVSACETQTVSEAAPTTEPLPTQALVLSSDMMVAQSAECDPVLDQVCYASAKQQCDASFCSAGPICTPAAAYAACLNTAETQCLRVPETCPGTPDQPPAPAGPMCSDACIDTPRLVQSCTRADPDRLAVFRCNDTVTTLFEELGYICSECRRKPFEGGYKHCHDPGKETFELICDGTAPTLSIP
ncbi:MAG: hypothetical protein AAGA72_07220 [Pseudomonadota bacterium]